MNERDIFLAAVDIEDLVERAAYLDEACETNAELRSQVEGLLQAHQQTSQFLETPAAAADSAVAQTVVSDTTADADAIRYKEPATLVEDCDLSDEIPLGYLEPSSKEGSLGRLAHYEILEVLGRGAFGTVLKAFDERLQRVVAIKVLSPEMAVTSPARKRFLREARASAAVRHENVVSIYAVEDDPTPYLVMEYIPGRTLEQRLNEHGPLNLPDVLRLGKQIADGLAAAHAQDLIHRDVKPGNILLETSVDDRVKITDFGLARTADDASMTQSGVIAGTPMYMAPEQALGRKLDQRADLFSLGSVLYQMLSGRPPFRAPSAMAVLKRVTEDKPRPIRELIPEVPNWMCEIVGHLHAKSPDKRYGSAKEVSELLARCLADMEAGRTPKIPVPAQKMVEPTARVRRPETRRAVHRPLTKIAAAVVVLFLGLAITEATDVTNFSSTVVRLVTGSGTLVIETDDPDVKIAVDGEEVTIRGAGVEELTLRPGEYQVAALKHGKAVKQELVSLTRNGRTVVRMSLETAGTAANTSNNRHRELAERVDSSTERGWIKLFNRTDLSGWKTHPDLPGQWEVNDGVLSGSSKTSYLFTERADFANFHFRMEVKVNGSGDGGVFFRAPFAMRHGPQAWMIQPASGYEVELYNQPEPAGSIWQINSGTRPNLLCRASGDVPTQADVWFTVELIAQENRFITKVNGQETLQGSDLLSRYSTGHLALYVQGAQTVVQFRKIEIQELPPFKSAAPAPVHRQFASEEWIDVIPLIDPQVDKWNIRATGKNEWRIDNGELVVGDADDKPSKLLFPLDSDFSPSFECELEFTRKSGDASFNINFPAADGDTPLNFDAPNQKGVFLRHRDKGRILAMAEGPLIETGKRTTARIEVRRLDDGVRISVWIDSVLAGTWTGDRSSLMNLFNEGYPHHRRVSLWMHAGGNEFVFHRIRLRMLDGGSAESVRPVTERQSLQWPADGPPPAIAPFDAEQAKQHQQAWSDFLGVPVEKELSLGQDKNGKDVTLTMVLIPPGEFMIGATDDEQWKWLSAAKAEHPNAKEDAFVTIYMEDQRFVRITRPFWLSKLEFTTGQFRRFVESTGHKTDAEINGQGAARPAAGKPFERLPELNWDNWGQISVDAGPVVNVSWNDAAKCCEWLSSQHPDMMFSLPTEAQWEFACRAGTKNSLYDCETSEELREYAQFGDEVHFIQRGGQLRPNAFGLYDMLGNVTEWCSNWLAGYAASQTDDPTGPAVPGKYEMRAVRGGSFMHKNLWRVRSSKRDFYTADDCFFDRGFRVAAAIAVDASQSQQLAEATAPTNVVDSKPIQWPADAPPPAIAPFDAEQAKSHQQSWADYLGVPVEKEILLGRNRRGLDVKLTLALIPPGEFLMGSSDEEIAKLREQATASGLEERDLGKIDLEGPPRHVRITRPFYLSKNEFTTDQFRAFVERWRPGEEYQTEPESSGKGAWTTGPDGTAVLDPEKKLEASGEKKSSGA